MDKGHLKKLIKNELREVCETHSFVSKSDTLYLRVTDDNILRIINFDLGSIGFTCSVAIQPLYALEHTNVISLNMGGRISRVKIVQNEWWPYEEPEKGIKEITNLLMQNGLPWFERYGTPKGIVDFVSNEKKKEYGLVSFDQFHQKKYLAFSLLYMGNLAEGTKCINELIGDIRDNAADFMLLYKKQLMDLIAIITSEPEKAPEILNAIVLMNKLSLKI